MEEEKVYVVRTEKSSGNVCTVCYDTFYNLISIVKGTSPCVRPYLRCELALYKWWSSVFGNRALFFVKMTVIFPLHFCFRTVILKIALLDCFVICKRALVYFELI